MNEYRSVYRGRRVMITGGLGFIGSNLAHQLVALDARVLLVRSLIPTLGWKPLTLLGDGLTRTLDYYREDMPHYTPTTASQVAAL